MDLGREIPSGPELAAPAPVTQEKKVSYPDFTIRDEAAKKFCEKHTCDLNTEFTATVKLKVTGLRKDTYGHSISFDVCSIDGIPEKEDDGEAEKKTLGYKRPKSTKEEPDMSAKNLTSD